MKQLIYTFLVVLLFLAGCNTKERIAPPKAKKIPMELTIHGHTRVDNYYWLRERENPEVIDFLEAENAYKEEVMAHTEPLQDGAVRRNKIENQAGR
jgi:oligopeptidase B